jgi:hypothetical protein
MGGLTVGTHECLTVGEVVRAAVHRAAEHLDVVQGVPPHHETVVTFCGLGVGFLCATSHNDEQKPVSLRNVSESIPCGACGARRLPPQPSQTVTFVFSSVAFVFATE